MTELELQTIKFIEQEYDIDKLICNKIDALSNEELEFFIRPKISNLIQEISKMLSISNNEALLLYNEYTEMMVKVSTMFLMKD